MTLSNKWITNSMQCSHAAALLPDFRENHPLPQQLLCLLLNLQVNCFQMKESTPQGIGPLSAFQCRPLMLRGDKLPPRSPMQWQTVCLMDSCFWISFLQESGLLNRPEIPRLSGLNRSLLVKAYDLGLIDVRGRTETRVVTEMLAAADAQVGGRTVLDSIHETLCSCSWIRRARWVSQSMQDLQSNILLNVAYVLICPYSLVLQL